MDKKQAKNRIKKLSEEINHHRYLYHVLDKQEISDAARDSLMHELARLENQYPEYRELDSPTQRVAGKALDKFRKVHHEYSILSLQDAFSTEELQEWEDRNKRLLDNTEIRGYYTELKLDGLSIVLTYEDGIFKRGATRGNGKEGEDVTQNLKTVESIPLKLQGMFPKKLVVRGEIIMTKKAFQEVNREQKKENFPEYANPRNTAAGSIRQLDSKITAQRKLDCVIFDILSPVDIYEHHNIHAQLKNWGFKTSIYNEVCKDLKEVGAYLKKWEKKRKTLPYETDGVVVVVDAIEQEKKLGSIGKSERWMIAYKFPAEQATTVVEDIQVQVGRTGALTPVAHLRAVKVSGSIVERATLHNQDEIDRLDVRVGDTVVIQKAGDIIPEVVEVLKRLRTKSAKQYHIPAQCPFCHSAVKRKEGEVAFYCSNKNCFAKVKQKYYHFVSKKAFDIEGLGPRIIDQLLDSGLVQTPPDIFHLRQEDLKPLERFAEKSSSNLIESIQKSKKIALSRFLFSLGIRHVGEETAISLAEHFNTIQKIQNTSYDELVAIHDVGEVVAKSIANYFQDSRNKNLLKDFLNAGVILQNPTLQKKTGRLKGKTLVLTGTLKTFTRDQAKEKIRKAEGKISGSVSKNTDYVIVGKEAGSKYEKAKKIGVPCISEMEFIQLIS